MDVSTGDLTLCQLNGQDLIVGEGHLLQHHHIAVAPAEAGGLIQKQYRLQTHNLMIGGLLLLLVGQRETQLIDVKLQVGLI